MVDLLRKNTSAVDNVTYLGDILGGRHCVALCIKPIECGRIIIQGVFFINSFSLSSSKHLVGD